MNKPLIIILLILLVIFLCCCCVMAVSAGLVFFNVSSQGGIDWNLSYIIEPPVPFPADRFHPPSAEAIMMLDILDSVEVPENDFRELGERFLGLADVPLTVPAKVYQIGDREQFWVTNSDTDEHNQITAVLRAETPHVYFWIEEGVNYKEADLMKLAEVFENQIYPTNRAFFGSEWKPGIDEDDHLYIIYTTGMGRNVAGYFSSIDSLHPLLQPYSNAHETFMISADAVKLDDEYTYSVLAHEFQHMIHWYQDRNETTWLNEGFSELAVALNGFSPGGFDMLYLANPDIQLNTWPIDSNATAAHYGASYLFVQYFLDQFGKEATQALVTENTNGLKSIDVVMSQLGFKTLDGSRYLTAEDIFINWSIANLINDDQVDQGQFAYDDYKPISPGFGLLYDQVNCTSAEWAERDVRQFGVDYISLDCDTATTLTFEGVGEVGLLPAEAYEGDMAMWSNKGSESDMRLTRSFDLSQVSGEVTLDYWVWFDLEESYDYVYVLTSADGENWTFVETAYGTNENPVGSNYGWGYNGSSNGWQYESIDLSDYAGGEVWVSFQHITDAALNGEGLLLDAMQIEAIGYSADFEDDIGGWTAEGFVRVGNRLAQSFALSLVKNRQSNTVVETYLFYGGESVTIDLSDINQWDSVIAVVSGTTRYTIQPANYRLMLVP
jgi:immune inhibitor A